MVIWLDIHRGHRTGESFVNRYVDSTSVMSLLFISFPCVLLDLDVSSFALHPIYERFFITLLPVALSVDEIIVCGKFSTICVASDKLRDGADSSLTNLITFNLF